MSIEDGKGKMRGNDIEKCKNEVENVFKMI